MLKRAKTTKVLAKACLLGNSALFCAFGLAIYIAVSSYFHIGALSRLAGQPWVSDGSLKREPAYWSNAVWVSRKEYSNRLRATYAMAGEKKIIAINLRHGLCNRLRALASAWALSDATHRWLRVISLRGVHFDADLSDVLNLTASRLDDVWNFFDETELDPTVYDVYDYMVHRSTPAFPKIDDSTLKHIYISSAYLLNNPLAGGSRSLQFREHLRRLVPHAAVVDRVASISGILESRDPNPLVGVHIRSLSPDTELRGLTSDAYPAWGWLGLAKRRRASSNVTWYADEMSKIFTIHRHSVFYVSSDNRNAVSALQRATAIDFIRSEATECTLLNARTARCLQCAFADLLILAQSSLILGSGWSSFTEVASRLAGVQARFPAIGRF